jgi:hypothetical protein
MGRSLFNAEGEEIGRGGGGAWKVSRQLEAAASVCPEVGHDDGSGPGGPRGPNGREAMVGQFQIKNKINKTKPVGFHRVWGWLREMKIVFKYLIQGFGIQIKWFKYFQTEFELDSK